MADSREPPSSRDVAGEEFLFHLYRGSELLQDDRVHDAKAELEQALSLQPSDPKGQDLLGIVYFRLGMYPRAISIYEQLVHAYPKAITPRVNLALSYLKTGQPERARVELERVIQQSPNHSRAWGYLGLAFQRMGDLEKATHAFTAGGHDAMARKLLETNSAAPWASLRPGAMGDSTPPSAAQPEQPGASSTETVEKARARERSGNDVGEPEEIARGPLSPTKTTAHGETSARAADVAAAAVDGSSSEPPASASLAGRSDRRLVTPEGPAAMEALARGWLLVFPRDLAIAKHPSGVVLAKVAPTFSTRFDVVRSMASASSWNATVLPRRMRGRAAEEPLGGAAAPFFELTGPGELVLAPQPGKTLHAIQLDEEPLYLREDALSGFGHGVTYENGRLPVGDGEAIPMVQLRGPGAVVASFPEHVTVVEITKDRSTSVRGLTVLGWFGRVVPRALTVSETPAGARGFVGLSGEGMVLLDAR